MLGKKDTVLFTLLGVILIALSIVHLASGQIEIGLNDYFNALFQPNQLNTDHLIILEFRIPRLVLAIIAGSGLAISGMLMQTLFNNPLAGPYVLGISSGSSLFVAIFLMSGFTFFSGQFGIILAAMVGAAVFGYLILFLSFFVRSHLSLLLIGLMIGSFTGAIISILQFTTGAQQLKAFTMWTMGSLQYAELEQLPKIVIPFVIACFLTFFLTKRLNALVLGEQQAKSLGIGMKDTRILLVGATVLFTGLITAFCGPIAFVGLAVPNMTRILFRTQNHFKLILANLLLGAIFLIFCDTIILILEPVVTIPINAFTSLLGAPMIIFLVLKRLK
jgi:iron complex transport system permease protein